MAMSFATTYDIAEADPHSPQERPSYQSRPLSELKAEFLEELTRYMLNGLQPALDGVLDQAIAYGRLRAYAPPSDIETGLRQPTSRVEG